MRRLLQLLLLGLLAAPGSGSPNEKSVSITVAEAAGERRFGYPVTAHVPLPRGAVRDTGHVVLDQGGKPVRGSQYDAATRWPDGSIQWLDVSFNVSPGPLTAEIYQLRFGPDVSVAPTGKGVVEETETTFLIRNTYRVPRSGPIFMNSVRYGSERLRAGATWTVRTDEGSLPLASEGTSRIVAAGPVNAVVERSGAYQDKDGKLPYRLTLAQPSSKSWIDMVLQVDDPHSRIREIVVTMPYAFQKEPARWDAGVGSWLYGTLRKDATLLLNAPLGSSWTASTATGAGAPSLYARQTAQRSRFEGWAHLIDGAPAGLAVAFGSPDWTRADHPLGGRLRLSGDGTVELAWTVSGKGPHTVRALFHHVADPVPVTAVTSPYAMLHPLQVSLPGTWYGHCGVPSPVGIAP